MSGGHHSLLSPAQLVLEVADVALEGVPQSLSAKPEQISKSVCLVSWWATGCQVCVGLWVNESITELFLSGH